MPTEPIDLSADPLAFGPPEATSWKKYSPNLEFPISLLVSTLFLTTMFAILVGLLFLSLGSGPEKKMPPMSAVDAGSDDAGNGSPGGGGDPKEALAAPTPPQTSTSGDEKIQNDFTIPEVKAIQREWAKEDPSADAVAVAPENAKSRIGLEKSLRDKLNGKGDLGPSKGPGLPGPGEGGTGANGTRARSLRWVMRFQTNGGRDYLDQLQALGAIVLVSVPPEGKQMYVFKDLRNPKPGTIATDAELASYSQQIQFCDPKSKSGEEVGRELNLSFTPGEFWAIFPKGIEEELSKLEKGYRNRRPEDVEQTIFKVSVVGGKYRLVVSEQMNRLGR